MGHQSAHLRVVESARFDGAFGLSSNVFDHVFGVVLHVLQHFGDAVAFDDMGDFETIIGQVNVSGVGVTEEVMEVSKNFLIRAVEKEPKKVRLFFFETFCLCIDA